MFHILYQIYSCLGPFLVGSPWQLHTLPYDNVCPSVTAHCLNKALIISLKFKCEYGAVMTEYYLEFKISTQNLHRNVPLSIHPGAETQAWGVNYHTERVLVIIDWRNARHLLMNMKTLHCASPNGFSVLMVVWEKLSSHKAEEVM